MGNLWNDFVGDEITKRIKAFLICPVRNTSDLENIAISRFVDDLSVAYDLYYPKRDTNQKDQTGLRICKDNRRAIKDADIVFVIWDGKSQGSLFDLGMAFAMNKPLQIVSIPKLIGSKSFQDMMTAWEKKGCE